VSSQYFRTAASEGACSGRSPKALHQSCGVIGAAPSSMPSLKTISRS
jgi:hypothetical protein